MNRQRLAAAGCILGATLAGAAVQAQEVHKCTLNGQVTYQAKPCGASDVVVPIPSGPSDRELSEAKRDLGRQRYQAATGRLIAPPPRAYVAPPPPPAPPTPSGFIVQQQPQITTTTTTLIVLPSRSTAIIRTTKTTRTNAAPPLPPPANNCEKLNRENGAAVDRRDELKAPGELQSRQEMLANVQAQIDRLRDMAQASNRRLAR